MTIYILRNIIVGTLYVGQTNNLSHRLTQHKNVAKGDSRLRLYRSIRKYGWENFCVIKQIECPEYLVDGFEQSLIKSLKEDLGERNVYNIADGGQKHKRHSVETRGKMSEIAKKNGRKPSTLAIKNSVKARFGEISPKRGVSLSQTQIEKMRTDRTAEVGKPVSQYDKNNNFVAWYRSINEASRVTKLNPGTIYYSLKSKKSKYRFRYDTGGVLSQ